MNRHPFLKLLLLVNIAAFVLAEIAALIFIPSGVPAHVRFLSGFLFPAGMLIFLPIYKKLDGRIAPDIKKAASERELQAVLLGAVRSTIPAVVCILLQALLLFVPYSGA